MKDLLKTIKSFGLSEFYFSLSIEDKENLAKYSKWLFCNSDEIYSYSGGCDECFMINSGAQLLWATAANAIPQKKLDFAEKLLIQALEIAKDIEDIAWIHANLAQVYYDKHKTDPSAGRKSITHCRKLIEIGYLKSWAQNMMEELAVFQV